MYDSGSGIFLYTYIHTSGLNSGFLFQSACCCNACMCVCMYLHIHIHMSGTWVHACMAYHLCVLLLVCIYFYTCMPSHVRIIQIHTNTYKYIHVISSHVQIHTCDPSAGSQSTHTHTHTNSYTHSIHTYAYISVHTCNPSHNQDNKNTHTHKHIYTQYTYVRSVTHTYPYMHMTPPLHVVTYS